MTDTWFSLHSDGMSEPIYISEIAEESMNPSFRQFDLNIYGPRVTRQDEVTVKVWARTGRASRFLPLIDLRVNTRSLQYIGKSVRLRKLKTSIWLTSVQLETFHHPLPPNCVLFHFSDGIYTCLTDLPLQGSSISPTRSSKQSQTVQPTSSFDALMRLSNLDNCIQDALATREKLATQISKLLDEQRSARNTVDGASCAAEKLVSTNRALANCRKQVQSVKSHRADLQSSLQARREAMVSGQLAQERTRSLLVSSEATLSTAAIQAKTTKAALSGQVRRICEELLTIHPIESIDPKSLSYTIRGIPLPNANSTAPHPDTDPSSTSAALGIVAHIVHLLSLYLSIPIPYPPSSHGSTSTIYDPISTSMPSVAARTFPLYQTGAVAYRFEYGVFLLNSDIELLMSRQGAKVVDLRHTLPNLKYILTVLTAGKGELPVRKKGGVRALDVGNGFAPSPALTASPLATSPLVSNIHEDDSMEKKLPAQAKIRGKAAT